MKPYRRAPSPACNIVTSFLKGGFSWSPSFTSVPGTVTLVPASTTASKGVPCTWIWTVNAIGGAQLSYHDALVSFIPKRGHGAVHPAPGFLCCKPPGLVLGSLSTSSALALATNLLTLLLTQRNSLVF